jgi:predicted RNase H-like HicB family nuclease
MEKHMTAIIEREGDGYVSLCPEVDIASQGATIEEARDNLREALELFFESASPDEITQRLREGSLSPGWMLPLGSSSTGPF